MKLTPEQAATVFDILVEHGNYDNRSYAFFLYKREDFIEEASSENGLNEYWYTPKSNGSIKLTIDPERIWVQAQTSTSNEATLVEKTNNALNAFYVKALALGDEKLAEAHRNIREHPERYNAVPNLV